MVEKNTERKFNLKKLISLNKYTITFLFVLSMFTIGTTYAYFAYQEEDTIAIKGNVVGINVELDVDLVVGTNTKMVPLQNDALSNALNGEGSDNGPCIDQKGNLSCQVYKITLTNNGSRLRYIRGTIELYAKSGSSNVYNNLKWRELTNPTTINSNLPINGMANSILVSDLTLESKDTKTWYIAVWISETNYDQLETDKGIFEGIVTFDDGNASTTNVFTETILAQNYELDTNIDFTMNSEESNTNGIYLRSGTENNTYPIYYYRGNVDNNLIFANFCWKVVRTTETGGLKLLYNGVPTNNQCNNTGEATQISTMLFNEIILKENEEFAISPAHLGYMYSTPYELTIDQDGSIFQSVMLNAYFGNDVIYENGMYTLTDTKTYQEVTSDVNLLNNHHYTCLNKTTTCESVVYLINVIDGVFTYLTLTDGKNIEQAFDSMFGADDNNIDNYNTISSSIKGNINTEGTLDYWYYTNIEQKGYSSYIEDAIWCNDRSTYSIGAFNPDGGVFNPDESEDSMMSSLVIFSSYMRFIEGNPNLTCQRNVDKFTINKSRSNGKLDYSIGLLTIDEAMLAGLSESSFTNYSSYYLGSGSAYYFNTPFGILGYMLGIFGVDSDGSVAEGVTFMEAGVRPSISLKPGFSLIGGDGKAATPYRVQ